MTLEVLLNTLRKKGANVSRQAFSISIGVPPRELDRGIVLLLETLLNVCGQNYFISIRGLPFCSIPNAWRRISYEPQNGERYVHIAACKDCSLRSLCPGWHCDIPLSSRGIKAVVDMPSEIVLEITGQCNLACGYCTSAAQNRERILFDAARMVLDDAHRNRVPAVRFTGGEPLLNPDLPRMLSYAKSKGFYVLLNTNATLVSPDLLKLFSSTVDNVLVSLQGFDDVSERELTQSPIPFIRKIQNILLLKSYVPTVRIGTVITPTLLDHWPRYVALVKKINPRAWELFRPMNEKAFQNINLTRKTFCALAVDLLRLRKNGINAKLANALPFCVLPNLSLATSVMLGAVSDDGNSRLVWDVRGFFKPSYFIERNLGRGIRTAWRHPFLKGLKSFSFLPQRCLECHYLLSCRCGSRALAFKGRQAYLSPDPLFFIAKDKSVLSSTRKNKCRV